MTLFLLAVLGGIVIGVAGTFAVAVWLYAKAAGRAVGKGLNW